MTKSITISLSYYNQSRDTLLKHITYWQSYPTKVRQRISFQIIDDCSKIPINELITTDDICGLDLVLYRVNEDLNCNMAGVRNLGATQCETIWFIPLDLDTLLPLKTARRLLALADKHTNNESTKNIYKFNRSVLNNSDHEKHLKTHPGVCFLKTSHYWNIGGNDEDLVGEYGYTDISFFQRAEENEMSIKIIENCYLEYIPEGESNIVRNSERNKKLLDEKNQSDDKKPRNFLRFSWSPIKLNDNIVMEKSIQKFFTTAFIGTKEMIKLCNNFPKVSNARYLCFTNLTSDEVNNNCWEIITIDPNFLNKLKEKLSGSAVRVSRYFKFHVYDYVKDYLNIDLHNQFLFYCDHYLHPNHKINWDQLCESKIRNETNDINILQYNHSKYKDGLAGDFKNIVRYRKDTGKNIEKTKKFLNEINRHIKFDNEQYYENTVFGLYLDDKVIKHLNEYWTLYRKSPTFRDQPTWNFLYLHKNIHPRVDDSLRKKKFIGDKTCEFKIGDYVKNNKHI